MKTKPTKNNKPNKELCKALKEGEKILKEIKKGKRKSYDNIEEMIKSILND